MCEQRVLNVSDNELLPAAKISLLYIFVVNILIENLLNIY